MAEYWQKYYPYSYDICIYKGNISVSSIHCIYFFFLSNLFLYSCSFAHVLIFFLSCYSLYKFQLPFIPFHVFSSSFSLPGGSSSPSCFSSSSLYGKILTNLRHSFHSSPFLFENDTSWIYGVPGATTPWPIFVLATKELCDSSDLLRSRNCILSSPKTE